MNPGIGWTYLVRCGGLLTGRVGGLGGGTSTAVGWDVIQFCYYKRTENLQHFEQRAQ